MARNKNVNTEETKVEDISEDIIVEETKPEIDYAKIIAEMQAQIESLKSQPVNVVPQVIVQQDKGMSGKKVRCINLMNCALNVSTEPDGKGRVFTFEKYGDYKILKYDDVADIVASYPYTMGNGLLYISDKEVVEELGLTYEYSKLYTKEKIDKLIYLREESDVDLLLGMESNLQETTLNRIAQLINKNEKFNYNFLKRIKEETDFDLEETAKRWKLADPHVSIEEKEELL